MLDQAATPEQVPPGVEVGAGDEVVDEWVVVDGVLDGVVDVDLVVVEDEVGLVVVGDVVDDEDEEVGIEGPPHALIALQSLLGSPAGWEDADHLACQIYPPKETCEPPAYVVPAT